MATYVPLDSIQRPSTNAPVSAAWFQQVNDNFTSIAYYYPLSGTVVGTTDSNGCLAITYPYPLPVPPTAIIAENGDYTASTMTVIGVYLSSGNNTGFSVKTTAANTGPVRIFYIVK